MLLVEITVGGIVHLISNEYIAIEHFYDAYVASLGQLRVATRQTYGGFAEPTFGQIDLLPTLFGPYLPQVSCPIKVSIATAGESDAVVVFQGIAHLNEIKRDAIIYDLYGPSYTTEVTDAVYSGTLNEIFATACSALSLTLNTTYARASSPAVDYKATGNHLLIDNLSDIAAFFAHRFYIIGTTLYLVDCLLDNGTAMALTEFDIFPSLYTYPGPISKFTAKYPAVTDKYLLFGIEAQGGGTNKASFSEIEFKLVRDGADITDPTYWGGTAFAANSTSPNLPANAVDNNAGTFWQSSTAAGPGMYWGFQFPFVLDGFKIVEYVIAAPPTLAESPVSWGLYGFDYAAAMYRLIKSEKTESDWTASEVRNFTLDQPMWDVVVAGTYKYGDENSMEISPVCHTILANIQTALTNIKTVMERPRVKISKPLTTIPRIGQKITLTDESLHVTTTIWARVAALVLDFDNDQCVIEGEGNLEIAETVGFVDEDIFVTDADGLEITDADGALIIEGA